MPVVKSRGRRWAFISLCVVAALLAGGYAVFTVRRGAGTGSPASDVAALAAPPAPPYLIVRSTASDATWRRLMLVPLQAPDAAGYATPLKCERAYFAGNRGVCLVEEGLFTKYYADVFDEHFTRLHRLPLTGPSSRTRVSADGRRAGITVFELGHSYAEAGFSTRTTIIDASSSFIPPHRCSARAQSTNRLNASAP